MENLNFVAIDLETATFERSSICEIGLAVVRDSKIVESRSWLVKPKHNYFYELNVSIHGITPEMTKDAPSFKDIWLDVLPYIEGGNIVAHNSAFDMYAIRDALDAAELEYPTCNHFCSMRAAKYTLSSYSYSLDCLTEQLNIPRKVSHRAEEDAIACAKVFIEAIAASKVQSFDEFQEKYNFKCGFFDQKNRSFKPQLTNNNHHETIKVSDIIGDPDKVDPANYIYGKSVCLTGTMSFGSRKSILQTIADIGGIPMNSITKKTDILIVGQQDYRVVGDTGMSSKQKKALDLRSQGVEIEILSEKEFLSLVQLPELIEKAREDLNNKLTQSKRTKSTHTYEYTFNINDIDE